MSQEKVIRYKEEKANRKALMKKAKRKAVLRTVATSVVVIAVLGWVGYSAGIKVIENQPRKSVTMDYKAVNSYLETLSAEDAE